MLRHSLIAFSIVLIAANMTLAKKEPAIPSAAGKQKQLALVRVNVTGQAYDYFRPWQKKAPFSKQRLERFCPKVVYLSPPISLQIKITSSSSARSPEKKRPPTCKSLITKRTLRSLNQRRKHSLTE